MTSKIGRPKKAKRQEKNIGFYVTRMQYFVIQQKAAKAGVNISDYMRQVAVNAVVKAKWTEEERQMVKRLIAMAGDIHQLAEQAKEEGSLKTALVFAKYCGILDEILKVFLYNQQLSGWI